MHLPELVHKQALQRNARAVCQALYLIGTLRGVRGILGEGGIGDYTSPYPSKRPYDYLTSSFGAANTDGLN